MAIGPGFYNQGDQKLYEDFQYLPQEQYRLNLGNNNQVNRLDFNNLSNSGIMSQAPIIYPPINQGGGGGDGPPGPDDDDENDSGYSGITGYDSLGNPTSNYTSPIDALKTTFAFMTNPFGYLGYKGYKAYKDKKAKKELQDFYNTTEAKTVQDMARDNKASNTGGYQAGYGGDFMDGPSGAGRGNAPSDKGGSDSMGSHADGGRVGYFFGGRVNYKVGGRTDAESQYGADSVGSYDSSQNRSDRQQSYGNDNNPPVSTGDNNKIVTTNFIDKAPNIKIDYTDPRNYASIYGKIGFNNILDNDDLTAEGNITGELGNFGYDASLTEKGLTGIDLTAGNFNANLNPDMQIQNIGYNNTINGINYGVNTDFDNTMLTAGVNFKNGGLAGLL